MRSIVVSTLSSVFTSVALLGMSACGDGSRAQPADRELAPLGDDIVDETPEQPAASMGPVAPPDNADDGSSPEGPPDMQPLAPPVTGEGTPGQEPEPLPLPLATGGVSVNGTCTRVCASAATDADATGQVDGWGWENEASCVVSG